MYSSIDGGVPALRAFRICFISRGGVLDCGADVNEALMSGAKLSAYKFIEIAANWAKTAVETAACRLLY
jgi:hypothetical protein